jgi:carbon monoxide dehydrogenase subunit G
MKGVAPFLRTLATLLSMLLLCALADGAAAQPVVRVTTAGQGGTITVAASAEMAVEAGTAWNVITDYDHLAEFIPDMQSSRVIRHDGDQLLVEQRGSLGFLFFQQPIEVTLSVIEAPQRGIEAHAVSGNMAEMDGRYGLETLPSGLVRLSYSGRLVPDFPVPPVVGRIAVRSVLERQFNALVAEIVRRDTAVRGAAPK